MKYIGIIPARYASTRFLGKPLAMIGNKSMIRRVFEQAVKCPVFDKVVVATDDERILHHVLEFGEAVMTGSHHRSGTDRCLEATSLISGEQEIGDKDVVINIQGDEPFIQPEQIELLASLFQNPDTGISTLVKHITRAEELFSPNIVKVVFDRNFQALYFSRSPIPFIRGAEQDQWLKQHHFFRHVGMYAYRLGVLKKIASLPFGDLEKAESLEQLRWMQEGYPIHVAETSYDSPGIDTPEDLRRLPPQWL